MKKIFIGLLFAYSFLFFILLAINFDKMAIPKAMILMGMTLFMTWVVLGGLIQKYFQKKYFERLTTPKKHPLFYFALMATLLACTEEAIAVIITNLAPLYGVRIGEAYITASSNYFTVILFHSVIVFIPMFVTLGFLLKRYDISPFQAFIIFGLVGVLAETLFAGPQALLNAPFWLCVYGLMVYLPAHIFIRTERRSFPFIFLPFLIPLIAFSAIFTAWIPSVLNVPKTDFAPIKR